MLVEKCLLEVVHSKGYKFLVKMAEDVAAMTES